MTSLKDHLIFCLLDIYTNFHYLNYRVKDFEELQYCFSYILFWLSNAPNTLTCRLQFSLFSPRIDPFCGIPYLFVPKIFHCLTHGSCHYGNFLGTARGTRLNILAAIYYALHFASNSSPLRIIIIKPISVHKIIII